MPSLKHGEAEKLAEVTPGFFSLLGCLYILVELSHMISVKSLTLSVPQKVLVQAIGPEGVHQMVPEI